MRIWRWLVATAALAGLPGAAAAAPCKIGRLAELQITMHGMAPWTAVQIDGKDQSFIVDSGAFFSTLTPAKASELGLRLDPAPWGLRVIGVGGEAAGVRIATVKTMVFSGYPVPRVEFLVVGQGGDGSAGLLGQNFLHLADDEFDLAKGVVRLIKPIDCGRMPLAYWVHPGSPYNAVEKLHGGEKDSQIYADVTVNGVRLRATLDTGATATVISSRAAARAGLTPQMEGAKPLGAAHGVGAHLSRTWTVPVGDFKFGDEEVRNTRLQIANIELTGSDMLLGADFFLSHHVYVSNSQGMIYFTYNGGNVFNLTAPLHTPERMDAAAASPAASVDAGSATMDEPNDADGFARRGAALAARKDFDGAIRDFDKAIALAPDNARVYGQRAMAHLALRQSFLAMADLDETLKRQPDNTDALLTRAELKIAGQDRAGAARDLDTASAGLAVPADARLRLAQDDERLDRYERVVAELDRWLPAHVDEAQTAQGYNLRCLARANLGKELDRALDDCNRALRANRSPAGLENRGLVHLRRGDYDRAIEDYDAALKDRPNLPWALYGRGLARSAKGDAAGGAADLAAAKALAPRIAEIASNRGIGVAPGPTPPGPAPAPSPRAAPSAATP